MENKNEPSKKSRIKALQEQIETIAAENTRLDRDAFKVMLLLISMYAADQAFHAYHNMNSTPIDGPCIPFSPFQKELHSLARLTEIFLLIRLGFTNYILGPMIDQRLEKPQAELAKLQPPKQAKKETKQPKPKESKKITAAPSKHQSSSQTTQQIPPASLTTTPSILKTLKLKPRTIHIKAVKESEEPTPTETSQPTSQQDGLVSPTKNGAGFSTGSQNPASNPSDQNTSKKKGAKSEELALDDLNVSDESEESTLDDTNTSAPHEVVSSASSQNIVIPLTGSISSASSSSDQDTTKRKETKSEELVADDTNASDESEEPTLGDSSAAETPQDTPASTLQNAVNHATHFSSSASSSSTVGGNVALNCFLHAEKLFKELEVSFNPNRGPDLNKLKKVGEKLDAAELANPSPKLFEAITDFKLRVGQFKRKHMKGESKSWGATAQTGRR